MANLPVYRDPEGNRFTHDRTSNTWRPMTDDDYSRIDLTKISDEFGLDFKDRFIMKNFSSNPAQGLAFLRGLKNPDDSTKYEVLHYGDGLNYMVRRPGETEWKVADPAKGGMGEFFRDVADLIVGDIALPALGVAAGTAIGGAAAGPDPRQGRARYG